MTSPRLFHDLSSDGDVLSTTFSVLHKHRAALTENPLLEGRRRAIKRGFVAARRVPAAAQSSLAPALMKKQDSVMAFAYSATSASCRACLARSPEGASDKRRAFQGEMGGGALRHANLP